ncbi:phage replisome organizer N-terminal domain-containing protein [Veillonella sp.]|uniref:phage replisome organizer N-terminal domain-containing protein n=1 Tax=Veillonella sp. TaxID=1926307 RepID=UPI00290BAB51|nr:phage replisome organizer N-terminal domain-containing protein [Veillonella sp.]MDU7498873.1 phage replisome organizer N-terminal domain-containing protein [Veillonella sp.]
MAEPKRYFWLKLHKDFFQRKEIKRLRKIAGGDTYTIIYLKMLLRSIMSEGKLYFDGLEEDFAAEVALDLDESEENVQITITYLLNSGLLEMRSDDEYYLPDTKNSTGCETAVAARVRRHREKQKALHCNADVTQVKHLCNGEIEIEKELDKEKDIEIEHRDRDITISTTRENKEIENSQSLTPMSNIDIYDLWTNSFGVISSFVKGSLDDLIAEYGLVNVADALHIAKERGKSRVQYVEGILKNQRLENGANGRNGSTRAATRKDEQVDWEQEAAKTYGQD